MKIPAFVRYWTASTTGSFGTAVSTVAVQVLVVKFWSPLQRRSES